jgi:16S rRNA (cytidine1402-2'-O)-methyltransferase
MRNTRKKTVQHGPQNISAQGTLYVVATPIGNLEDITLRALRILKEVDLIAAEDTRHTKKLLSHFGIATPTLSYFKEKEKERSAVIIDKLNQGLHVALVSDAGTPGISDPGSILVQQAAAASIRVEPIPGPSSLTAALSVAGTPDTAFVFLGFAPSRKKQRRDLLLALREEKRNLIFFEAPHRLQAFLQDCYDILGDRHIFWCRELTKMHEELTRDHLGTVLARCMDRKIKGESVFIIAGAEDSPAFGEAEITALLAAHKKSGTKSLKDAVQTVTREYNLSRSVVYGLALKVWQQ